MSYTLSKLVISWFIYETLFFPSCFQPSTFYFMTSICNIPDDIFWCTFRSFNLIRSSSNFFHKFIIILIRMFYPTSSKVTASNILRVFIIKSPHLILWCLNKLTYFFVETSMWINYFALLSPNLVWRVKRWNSPNTVTLGEN